MRALSRATLRSEVRGKFLAGCRYVCLARLRGDLLEQPPSLLSSGALCHRRDPVSQFEPVVLAVADTLRDRLDGAEPFCLGPHRLYGVALLMPALAWHLLQLVIIRSQRADSPLAQAIGRDFEGKVSPVRYIAGILLAFIHPRITC